MRKKTGYLLHVLMEMYPYIAIVHTAGIVKVYGLENDYPQRPSTRLLMT